MAVFDEEARRIALVLNQVFVGTLRHPPSRPKKKLLNNSNDLPVIHQRRAIYQNAVAHAHAFRHGHHISESRPRRHRSPPRHIFFTVMLRQKNAECFRTVSRRYDRADWHHH